MEFTVFFAGVILGGLIAASIVYAYFNSINSALKEENSIKTGRIEILKEELVRNKHLINSCSQYTIDIYKDLLSKFMDGPSATTDKFFMFEGRPYRPTEFTLNREEGRNETLDVTFVRSDF